MTTTYNNEAPFPHFWLETQACWGEVNSVFVLMEKYRIWKESGGQPDWDLTKFLQKCRSAELLKGLETEDLTNFGLRHEHRGRTTLYNFLKSKGVIK